MVIFAFDFHSWPGLACGRALTKQARRIVEHSVESLSAGMRVGIGPKVEFAAIGTDSKKFFSISKARH
jgi:hypothetical protein